MIGTAVHELVHSRLEGNPLVLSEVKLPLGVIEGYGEVALDGSQENLGGTTDIFFVLDNRVTDLKTTKKHKLALYKRVFDGDESESLIPARHIVEGYLNQLMLYGWGLENLGYKVETVSFAFVPVDGMNERDLYTKELPYDRARAEEVWDRAVKLWAWLQEENDPATLPSAPGCYYCENLRRFTETEEGN